MLPGMYAVCMWTFENPIGTTPLRIVYVTVHFVRRYTKLAKQFSLPLCTAALGNLRLGYHDQREVFLSTILT